MQSNIYEKMSLILNFLQQQNPKRKIFSVEFLMRKMKVMIPILLKKIMDLFAKVILSLRLRYCIKEFRLSKLARLYII